MTEHHYTTEATNKKLPIPKEDFNSTFWTTWSVVKQNNIKRTGFDFDKFIRAEKDTEKFIEMDQEVNFKEQ